MVNDDTKQCNALHNINFCNIRCRDNGHMHICRIVLLRTLL